MEELINLQSELLEIDLTRIQEKDMAHKFATWLLKLSNIVGDNLLISNQDKLE